MSLAHTTYEIFIHIISYFKKYFYVIVLYSIVIYGIVLTDIIISSPKVRYIF